jgi:hypothetical protein
MQNTKHIAKSIFNTPKVKSNCQKAIADLLTNVIYESKQYGGFTKEIEYFDFNESIEFQEHFYKELQTLLTKQLKEQIVFCKIKDRQDCELLGKKFKVIL